ncbi:unnamed protein product [Boreogadus saida]
MPLYSDISGTETGKCTDCTKLQQTVALFETRLAALEKCKGLLQDTVPMDSTNVPATHAPLSPEMRPDGQCGQRRNKNQSPWRRAAHASATCAPLTPEMCPDRRYGQTWNNQSPQRRAAHVSATVQQGPISEKADEPDTLIIGDSTIKDITGKKIKTCNFPYGMATIRAQVEKKRDYSLHHTSTLPLSDTQIADSPQTLKRDNSLPDAINTVPSPIADAGLARNGHPPPLHSPIDDDLQPHLSHSHNNSSSNVSSLCDFPAEYKKLEYVGIKLTSVSMIASPRHGHRLITPKRMAPQPPPCTNSSPEYY